MFYISMSIRHFLTVKISYNMVQNKTENKTNTFKTLSLRHRTLHMIWETMETLPFLAGKDVVSARWTSKCERRKGGNEEIFRGCSFISHYTRDYKETVMQFLLHLMINISRIYTLHILTFCTLAFWCTSTEGLRLYVIFAFALYLPLTRLPAYLLCSSITLCISVHLHPNLIFFEPPYNILSYILSIKLKLCITSQQKCKSETTRTFSFHQTHQLNTNTCCMFGPNTGTHQQLRPGDFTRSQLWLAGLWCLIKATARENKLNSEGEEKGEKNNI